MLVQATELTQLNQYPCMCMCVCVSVQLCHLRVLITITTIQTQNWYVPTGVPRATPSHSTPSQTHGNHHLLCIFCITVNGTI